MQPIVDEHCFFELATVTDVLGLDIEMDDLE
jgi:hypothetical protein